MPPSHHAKFIAKALASTMLASTLLAVALSSTASATAATTGTLSPSAEHALPTLASTPRWAWPIEPPHSVVRVFIAPANTYSAGHRGIDIASPPSGMVHSPAGGVIHFSGFVVDRNVLSIDHGDGLISSFEPILSALTEGTVVSRGDELGTVESGHCESPCLHFGVRLLGHYISPLNYLEGITRSVLLPTREVR